MNSFVEVTLIDNEEMTFSRLWSTLFTQVHLAFVERKDTDNKIPYGISFPEYKLIKSNDKRFMVLGSKLRIFANSANELEKLDLDKWLERLTDYVHIKSVKPVKNVTCYLNVNRYRPRANAGRLARRYAKRHDVSFEDAMQRLTDYTPENEAYPYIKLNSLSGGDEFSLCINQTTVDEARDGKFSTYGLSATSTVPHW